MIDGERERAVKFLSDFSEEELLLNGHAKKYIPFLAGQYLELLGYVKEGNYLEMGCGTGIICKFIDFFSKKEHILYGIDRDFDKIELAKKNNAEFKDNFTVADFFNLNFDLLPKFSTITIFIPAVDYSWERVESLIFSIFKSEKTSRVIVFSYDRDLLQDKGEDIKSFISIMEEKLTIDCFSPNFFVIENKS